MGFPLPLLYTLADLLDIEEEEYENTWVSIVNQGFAGGKGVDQRFKSFKRKWHLIMNRLKYGKDNKKDGE